MAFQNYRKAIDRAPDNIGYKLKISEILTDMERYEESNQWLLRLSRETEPVPESCEFGIGYNYLCMQEYELARPCPSFCSDIPMGLWPSRRRICCFL